MNDRFILTVKELHFGHIKETFRMGAVIEHDVVNGRLIVDGRKFEDTRDLDILKRQAVKHPDNAWILPYSEENLAAVTGAIPPKVETKKPRPGENMQIIQSDEDLTESIDIRNTQVSKRNQEIKEAQRQKVKSNKMEIIKGDETVEERLASLKGKNDMNSMAERARLKAAGPANMPVVKDDSLGAGVSKSAIPLNAGQVLPSREVVEAKSEEAKALADARKKQAEKARQVDGVVPEVAEVAEEPEGAPVDDEGPISEEDAEIMSGSDSASIEMEDGDTDADKDAEIAQLKAKIAALEANNAKPPSARVPVTVLAQARKARVGAV